MPVETTPTGFDPAGLSFEEALTLLERVVERLEAGTLPLEESLREYEAGVALSRHCALLSVLAALAPAYVEAIVAAYGEEYQPRRRGRRVGGGERSRGGSAVGRRQSSGDRPLRGRAGAELGRRRGGAA